MHHSLVRVCLALCLGSASLVAAADDALLWQDNSLTLLHGSDFEALNFNAEEQRSQTTLTFEHASGWVWGDLFAFYDHVRADNLQYTDNFLGKQKHSFRYLEFSPRISLGWLSGRSLSVGPLRDLKAAFTYEEGNGGPGTQNYLFGLGLDWQVPGFRYLQTNLYRVKLNEHVFFRDRSGDGYAEQLTVAGAYPLQLGGQDFLIDGYVDWRSPSRQAGTQTSLGSSLQFKWDAGKSLFGEAGRLYAGTELNYWRNKYGLRPVDGTDAGFRQRAWQALLKYHF